MTTKKAKFVTNVFSCEPCDYTSGKKCEYNKHILTAKHKNTTNYNTSVSILKQYTCECEKKYAHRASLYNHKKKCKIVLPVLLLDASNNDISVLSNLVIELVKNNTELQKQNQDFQKQMLEICKNNKNNTVINSNNNNKTFNLQLFLNEECKDAMNMSEFIKSIDLQLVDLENFAEVDYAEGMSNLIIKQLKNTDMYKRPVHCSDGKRETLYIKEENKWEKEGPENKKMVGAVRAVDKKNIDLLFQWKDEHPTCLNTDSQYNDHYIKLLRSVISGSEENVNKVIKKVSKEVRIDK